MKENTQLTVAHEEILGSLSQIKDPDLGRDIVSLGFVKDLQISGENVSFTIELTTPACPVREPMRESAHRAVLSYKLCRSLARHAVFVGLSSGAYLKGALEVARESPRARIVTVFSDLGERYFSTRLWEL